MDQARLNDRNLLNRCPRKTETNQANVLPFSRSYLPKPALRNRHNFTPSAEAVRAQLSQILRSSGFVHACRMQQFLEFVIEETLAGRAHQLCEYSIGVSVFGRNEFFNPSLDPIVRNDARRLRHKLSEYYLQLKGENDNRIRIDIPKGGYIPVFNPLGTQSIEPGKSYRLSVKLTRLADGVQIWNTEHDLEDEPCELQLLLNSKPKA